MPTSPSGGKMQISLEVPYSEKISRLFIFRFLWAYLLIFPMIPLSIWVAIVGVLHFFYMLFMGKRHKGFWFIHKRFFVWVTEWQGYMGLHVDRRPAFWW